MALTATSRRGMAPRQTQLRRSRARRGGAPARTRTMARSAGKTGRRASGSATDAALAATSATARRAVQSLTRRTRFGSASSTRVTKPTFLRQSATPQSGRSTSTQSVGPRMIGITSLRGGTLVLPSILAPSLAGAGGAFALAALSFFELLCQHPTRNSQLATPTEERREKEKEKEE